jgi:uncharacterized protein CbrC (UPF0167 family)
MNKVLDYTQYTEQDYIAFKFDLYFTYLQLFAHTQEDLQQVLANTPLYNWWNQEYTILEEQFLEDIEPYIGKVSIEVIRDFYDENMTKIANYFSKTLVKKARKQQIIIN